MQLRRCRVTAREFLAECPHGLLVVWQMHVVGDKPGCDAHAARYIDLREGY
jgi:hypothetical protein